VTKQNESLLNMFRAKRDRTTLLIR